MLIGKFGNAAVPPSRRQAASKRQIIGRPAASPEAGGIDGGTGGGADGGAWAVAGSDAGGDAGGVAGGGAGGVAGGGREDGDGARQQIALINSSARRERIE